MDRKNQNTKKEYSSYLVTDEELLYRLASCSLLDKLCRVAPSKRIEGTRVWFFDKDPGVLNVIRQYKAEKIKRHNEENSNADEPSENKDSGGSDT